jgi:hypothetical protein
MVFIGIPWVASLGGPGGREWGCDPRLCSSIPLGWWGHGVWGARGTVYGARCTGHGVRGTGLSSSYSYSYSIPQPPLSFRVGFRGGAGSSGAQEARRFPPHTSRLLLRFPPTTAACPPPERDSSRQAPRGCTAADVSRPPSPRAQRLRAWKSCPTSSTPTLFLLLILSRSCG